MASGEAQSPLKGPKLSASSSSSRNDCDEIQWMLLPNNLEISPRSKPSKKQRNKEKLKSFLPDNIAPSNMSEGFSSSPISFQNLPRAKSNTASWLKDQFGNDDKSRKRTQDSEEFLQVFSDTELSLTHGGAMNFPVNHRAIESPEYPEEIQRPSSKRSMVENSSKRSNKEDLKKNEVMMEEFCKIKEAMKQVADGEREHKVLLQQMASENGGFPTNGNNSSASSESKASNCNANISLKATSGATAFCSEEEHTNKCNHLLEKMKQSEERLMSLKKQESLLYHMQKSSLKKDKLLVPEVLSSMSASCSDEQPHTTESSFWNSESFVDQRQDKFLQGASFDESEKQLGAWKEPQNIKQLHMSLERIRKRVQSMQQNPDVKNITRSLSSDDCEIGERVAAVELERKKLKNKLVELQEKKKMNDELLQELSYLKETTVPLDVIKKEDGSNLASASTRSARCTQSKQKRRGESGVVDTDGKLFKLQSTLQHLEGMMKAIVPEESIQNGSITNESSEAIVPKIDSRNVHSVACMKRDNVRKEMNSGFPARRHYEAEGRANEDADLPAAAVPNQSTTLSKWSPEMQEKLRKHQVAQRQKIKVINDIMFSIQEAKKTGRPFNVEHLQLLSSLDGEENNGSDRNQSSVDSGEETYYDYAIPENKTADNMTTNMKEVCSEGETALQQAELKLLESQHHVQLMKDVMTSLQECEKSGTPIPIEHLRVLVDLHKDKNEDSDTDSDSETDYDCMIQDNNPIENTASQVKAPSVLHQNGGVHRGDVSPAVPYNTELASRGKKDFASLVSQINELMQLSTDERNSEATNEIKKLSTIQSQLNRFIQMSIEGGNDDMVRSSGEGGYISNRNSESIRKPSEHVQLPTPTPQYCHHQDNLLLTRQNIANMEFQNENSSRNLQSRNRTKKDNINNLSGKMGKLCIQNTMNDRFSRGAEGPKDNLDSVSTLSSELNQSHCGELERKTILDILKRGRKKQKVYDRNQDNRIHSNSSINSETFEGSTCALAPDTTVAATWGGSSTQENFEDENEEPTGGLVRQHGVDGSCVTVGPNYNSIPKTRTSAKLRVLPSASGTSNELPNSGTSSDAPKDCQQQISSHFIHQLKKQIHQLNALCQEELLSEGCETLNFHQNSTTNLLNPGQPIQAVPEIIHPYNQQLLLCLNQCYHTLYMQQLEIQHLHRCIRHNIDAESIHQVNNLNSQGSNGEELGFRPWCMSTCSNPLMPSNLYPNDQVSPRSAATYLPIPLKPYSSHNTSVTGTRPVRAVIHPASQENRTAQETLNNQVPPRTRANNFWDNFRSYSRQNLLSTSSNGKRNENVGLPVAPQIRQVHPMVSNENTLPGTEINSFSSVPPDFNRSMLNPSRTLSNSHFQDVLIRSKKPNAITPASANHGYTGIKKGSLLSSDVRNLRSEQCREQTAEPTPALPLSNPSSVNLIQLYPIPDDSKIGNFASICPTSTTESTSSHVTLEQHRLPVGDNEYHSDFLIGLYREAKALRSDAQRQKALKIIRDIARSDKGNEHEQIQSKVHNDHSISTNKLEVTSNAPTTPAQAADMSSEGTDMNTNDIIDAEKPANRLLTESSLPWINQNLPTAAISPLSKQVAPRSVSTGAVRKKTKPQSTSLWDSLSTTQTSSSNSQENQTAWDGYDATPLQPIRENNSDFPGSIVENILLDLQAALPFGQMKEDSTASFWSSVVAFIISRIRAHMNVPLPHKSLASLRQSLFDHVLPLFSGMKFCDCEAEFLKYISQLLYDSLTCFMSTGRFTSSPQFSSAPDISSIMESMEKTQELCVKMPADSDDKTQELSINMYETTDDVFLPHCQAVLQENASLCTETENVNIDNIQDINVYAVVPEEEVGCEWGPEAEAEPEVEAGTEADLAEADQSPGQQGNISSTSLPSTESWSVDQASGILRNMPSSNNAIPLPNDEESNCTLDTEVIGAHSCPDVPEEIKVEDVSIKVCSTEEEPQKLDEEQVTVLSSLEYVKEDEEHFPESNSSENELTSTK